MAQKIKTALVVDDSRLARLALGKLLKHRGIEVEVADCGADALEYLRGTRPDVVFMDYMMPDMDGFEASRRVLADPTCRQPPIVMYTSQDTDEDRARARDIGVSGFLVKPAAESALDDVLATVAARPVPVDPALAAPAVGQAAAQDLQQLRQELADGLAGLLRQATEAAERSAAAAVEAALKRLVPAQEPLDPAALEARARQVAEETAQQAAGPVGRDAGTAAARALAPQLLDEARQAATAMLQDAELQTRMQSAIEQSVVPGLRRELLSAGGQAAEAAVQAALEQRLADLEGWLTETARQFAMAEAQALRGGLLGKAIAAGVAAGVVAGLAAGVLL